MNKFKFSGHQTFSLRYGWLEKGFRFCQDASCSFSAPDALVHLGVGKNMVSSIEYWCKITGLLSPTGQLSSLAKRILDEKNGWDPYLEDDASWWLIHWKISTNPEYLTAGTVLFSLLRRHEFSKIEIKEYIENKIISTNEKRISSTIIDRDIECYIRTYSAKQHTSKSGEIKFESPLQDLRLIEPLPSEIGSFRFNIGPKRSLPPHVIGYAIWERLHITERKQMFLKEALHGEYSPGQVFMLDESSLEEAINTLLEHPQFSKFFRLTKSLGSPATVHCNLPDGSILLDAYYKGDTTCSY